MNSAATGTNNLGLVLCGGRSSRMGTAKYALRLGGETLLQRICRIVGESTREVVVVAAPDQEIPALRNNARVTRDDLPGEGPLAGICCGLTWLQRETGGIDDLVFVTSCDAPLLSLGVVRFILAAAQPVDAAAVRHEGRVHPLCAAYRLGTAEVARDLLDQGERRPRMLLESVRTRYVEADELRTVDPHLDSLQNANTPEEFDELAALFASRRRENDCD